jgi:hypothetical protein
MLSIMTDIPEFVPCAQSRATDAPTLTYDHTQCCLTIPALQATE